jgi:ribulose-5-phosphate 4-epimerase/fuculose-1-phosphate aldolase
MCGITETTLSLIDNQFQIKHTPMSHIDFSPSGSDNSAKKVAQVARREGKFQGIMLDEHGIIAVGIDLVQAYNFADLAEELAKIANIPSAIL